MATVKKLIEQHGYGIHIVSGSPVWADPMVVVNPSKNVGYVEVIYDRDGSKAEIFADCESCNDYELVQE